MKPKVLINFTTSPEKKAGYTEACLLLGTSVSNVCRMALDNSVQLASKLKTLKTSAPPKSNLDEKPYINDEVGMP